MPIEQEFIKRAEFLNFIVSNSSNVAKMNKPILWLAVCCVLSGCRDNNQSRHVLGSLRKMAAADHAYPLIIDGWTKIVYQFGHMTPDKGLKLYYDTIPYPASGVELDEEMRIKLSAK